MYGLGRSASVGSATSLKKSSRISKTTRGSEFSPPYEIHVEPPVRGPSHLPIWPTIQIFVVGQSQCDRAGTLCRNAYTESVFGSFSAQFSRCPKALVNCRSRYVITLAFTLSKSSPCSILWKRFPNDSSPARVSAKWKG